MYENLHFVKIFFFPLQHILKTHADFTSIQFSEVGLVNANFIFAIRNYYLITCPYLKSADHKSLNINFQNKNERHGDLGKSKGWKKKILYKHK